LNRRPLRPELAAVLDDWPVLQLAEGAGDSSCSLLSGVVAVLGCCIVTGHTLRGWSESGPGSLPPGRCLLAGVPVRGIRDTLSRQLRRDLVARSDLLDRRQYAVWQIPASGMALLIPLCEDHQAVFAVAVA
jgi:hypothetical protein